MANGWTPERRAKQAEAIRRWKPWEKSTGPRTDDGKEASSQNAWKHGLRTAGEIEDRKRFNEVMRAARAVIQHSKDAARERREAEHERKRQIDKL